jgi:hypothetical protein
MDLFALFGLAQDEFNAAAGAHELSDGLLNASEPDLMLDFQIVPRGGFPPGSGRA